MAVLVKENQALAFDIATNCGCGGNYCQPIQTDDSCFLQTVLTAANNNNLCTNGEFDESPGGWTLNGNFTISIGASGFDAQMLIVNDTGLVISTQIVDTAIPHEKFFWKAKSKNNTIVLLEHYSHGANNDSSTDIKILKYSLAADSFYYEKLFEQLYGQDPRDMELLSNGGIAVTFSQLGDSSTCSLCTGLLVVDSTGCNPDLCATSISEVATPKMLTVYPNPCMDVVTIRSPEGELLRQITIMDITGSLVWHQNLTNPVSTYAISLPSLAAGVFFITAKSNQNYYYAKIIKE